MLLLDEQELDSKAQWRKVRSKIEKDPRFKAVENTFQREEWFKEHIEQLFKVTISLHYVLREWILLCLSIFDLFEAAGFLCVEVNN